MMKLVDFFLGHHERKWIQITRAGLSSLLGTVLDYGTMFLLVEIFHVDALKAGTCGMVTGLLFVYIAGRLWVFPPVPRNCIGMEATFYIMISLIGALVHTLVLSIGLRHLHLHYVISKGAASLSLFAVNFSLRRSINRLIRNSSRYGREPSL